MQDFLDGREQAKQTGHCSAERCGVVGSYSGSDEKGMHLDPQDGMGSLDQNVQVPSTWIYLEEHVSPELSPRLILPLFAPAPTDYLIRGRF